MKKTTALLLSILLLTTPAAALNAPRTVIPGGHTLGIKLFTGGLLIIGLVSVEAEENAVGPAEKAGLVCGDIITRLDESEVSSVAELQELIASSKGEAIDVVYQRDGKEKRTRLTPALSPQDGRYKIGAWIRDSIAGIGTVTFYEPESGLFGALGHGVNDHDTGKLLPLDTGYVLYSEVESVRMGQPGQPGELKGNFRTDMEYGELLMNADNGLFGILSNDDILGPQQQEAVELCPASQVKTGPAEILSNVAGDTVKRYRIEIVKLYGDKEDMPSFMIHVTDPELLAITGGIVQGMSGSPILQEGRLVGAVTHVLINDPTRGYGLMIDNMLKSGMECLEGKGSIAA